MKGEYIMRLYSFNIDEALLKRLKDISVEKSISVSALIRLILLDYVRDYYNEQV